MGKGNVMQEFVIRLGAQMDNQGVQDILKYMDLTKLKALGLTAALAGLTTAIYKFASATATKEYELQKLAKEQHKTTAAINAQNTALKSMGKTMDEIKKDKSLEKTYKDLKKLNEEMKLPNVDEAMKNVTKLRNAFWKLKDVLNYTVQAIGRQFLINMEEPIKRITGGLDKISSWVKNNLNSIAAKVSSYLTAFSKGIIGIGETIGKIFEWINMMPSGVKAIGTAFAAIAAMFTMGPLGRIIAMITLIGDIIHDAENYQWNKKNAKTGKYKDKNGKPVQVDTALDSIWSILFDDEGEKGKQTIREKTSKIAQQVFDGIIEGLTEAINFLNKPDGMGFTEWFEKFTGPLGEALGGIVDWAKSPEGTASIQTLAEKFLSAVESVLTRMGELGVSFTNSAARMLYTIFGGVNWADAWDNSGLDKALDPDNSIADGLATAIELSLAGADFTTSILGGILSSYHKAREESLRKLYDERKKDKNWAKEHPLTADNADEKGNPTYTWLEEVLGRDKDLSGMIGTELQNDFNTTINAVLPLLFDGLELASDAARTIFDTILKGIIKGLGKDESEMGNTVKEAFKTIDPKNTLFNSILLGFGTWIGTGNVAAGLITGIANSFAQYSRDGGGGLEKLRKDAEELKETVLTIWYGAWEDDPEHPGKKRRNGIGLKAYFDVLFGENGVLKDLFTGLAKNISTWLDPVEKAISEFFANLWRNVYNNAPDWIKDLGLLGKNPNKTSTSSNENGTATITDTSGNTRVIEEGESEGITTSDVMDAYGDLIYLDDDGRITFKTAELVKDSAIWSWVFSGKGTFEKWVSAFKENQKNPKALAYLFSLLRNTDESFSSAKDNTGLFDGPWWSGEQGSVMDDFSKKIDEFVKNGVPEGFKIDLPSEVSNPTGVDEARAKGQQEADEKPIHYSSVVDPPGNSGYSGGKILGGAGKDKPHVIRGDKAWGGRIGSEGQYTVGEDGPEYIIPITKQERAATLIHQMLTEMGSSAVSKIISGLGLGQSGTNGASLASLETAMGGMAMTNSYNINAPVNINVNSSGADAREIGSTVYDLAERHLIKNVMGVYS